MTKKLEAEKISFEEGLKELEGVVRKLEAGNLDLEAAIAEYQRGVELKTICAKKLEEAKLKVEKIVKSADGSLKTEPFDS